MFKNKEIFSVYNQVAQWTAMMIAKIADTAQVEMEEIVAPTTETLAGDN